MNFFMNLMNRFKLRTKIFVGYFGMFVLILVMGSLAFMRISHIDDLKDEVELLSEMSESAASLAEAQHVWRYSLLLSFIIDIPFSGNLDPASSEFGRWQAAGMGDRIDDPELSRLIQGIEEPNRIMHQQAATAVGFHNMGRLDMALAHMRTDVLQSAELAAGRSMALSARYDQLMNEALYDMQAAIHRTILGLAIIVGISLVVFVLFSLIVGRSILMPIRKLASMVSDIAQGRLNVNRKAMRLANDEIGQLVRDTYKLGDTIASISDDLIQTNKTYNLDGDIDYRIDADKYVNSYREVVQGVNAILEQQTEDTRRTVDIVTQVAEGDFESYIGTAPGKRNVLPETLRNFREDMKKILYATKQLAQTATKGRFDEHIDETQFKGNWHVMAQMLNNLMDAVEGPLKEIEYNVLIMAEGDFAMLEGELPGTFGVVQRACNHTNDVTLALIEEISDILGRLADGDLTVEARLEYVGSYAPIKEALVKIIDALNETMTNIGDATEKVAMGAAQIASAIQTLAIGAVNQGEAIEVLSDTIHNIYDKATQASSNAVAAEEATQQSKEKAETGGESVKSMTASMDKINASNEDVSKIIDVITNIAFQTNLLALNASVEAARAGEHGRGFSVVAEEVRTLAGRSQKSAADTTGIILENNTNVTEGMKAVADAVSSFEAIASNIGGISTLVSQIAEVSGEQLSSISAVNTSVDEINRVVNENAASAEESATATQVLSAQADILKTQVAYFKLK